MESSFTAVCLVIALMSTVHAQDRYCSGITNTTCGSQSRPGCTVLQSTTSTSAASCEASCQATTGCWYFEYVDVFVAPSTCTLYSNTGSCEGCASPVAGAGDESGYCSTECQATGTTGPAPAGTACHNASLCTYGVCDSNGNCQQTPIVCSDNNLCTSDQCDNTTGYCSFATRACAQNTLYKCIYNQCNPATGDCASNTVDCDDDNGCTIDSCSNSTGCLHEILECVQSTTSCYENVCNGTSGVCVTSNTPKVCNDGNVCTTDTCVAGEGCTYTPLCNDNNACTTDSCNAATGGCTFLPITCNDGLACTVDTCNANTGACVYTPNCNDNNACTTDTCTSTGCTHIGCLSIFGSCTVSVCNDPAVGCVAEPKNCNDNNACTTDTCSGRGVCNNTNNCVPPNQCSISICNVDDGECSFGDANCDDGIACTADTCNDATGCVHTSTCNDNNLCTTDICGSNGVCSHIGCLSLFESCTVSVCGGATVGCVSEPKNCNDNNVCTTDSCSGGTCINTPIVCASTTQCYNSPGTCGVSGCVYTPKASGTTCNDGNSFTFNDVCNGAGTCSGRILIGRSAKFDVQGMNQVTNSTAPLELLQTRTDSSLLPDTMYCPSAENATLVTLCVCPSSFFTSAPLELLQIRTELSLLPDTMHCPSGENATVFTLFVCPSSFFTSAPLELLQTRMELSQLHDTMYCPSGENETLLTHLSMPKS